MSSKSIVSLVLFILVIAKLSLAAPNKPKGNVPCPEQLKEVDRIFKVLLLMNKRRLLPQDEAKHAEYCKDVLSLGKRVARYSKCEKPFAGQVLTILSNGVKKPIKYICTDKKKVSMESFACMTDSFVDKIQQVEAGLVKNLKYITQNASCSDALPLFCCTMIDYIDNLGKLGTPKCSSDSIHAGKFIHERIYSGSADVLDLVCSTYKTSQMCETKNPKMMATLRESPPAGFSVNNEPFAAYFTGAVTKMA